MTDDDFPNLSDEEKARIMDEVDAEQGVQPDSELVGMAAVILDCYGIGPDDLEDMAELGVSDNGKLQVLLPEEFNPTVIGTVLAMMTRTILDVGQASRVSRSEVEELIQYLQAGGKTQ